MTSALSPWAIKTSQQMKWGIQDNKKETSMLPTSNPKDSQFLRYLSNSIQTIPNPIFWLKLVLGAPFSPTLLFGCPGQAHLRNGTTASRCRAKFGIAHVVPAPNEVILAMRSIQAIKAYEIKVVKTPRHEKASKTSVSVFGPRFQTWFVNDPAMGPPLTYWGAHVMLHEEILTT